MRLDGSVTDHQQTLQRRSQKRQGILALAFLLMVVIGTLMALIPLESVAEVNSNGGAAHYCKERDAPAEPLFRAHPDTGLISCSGGKPDYFPALPFSLGGSSMAAAGVVGIIVLIAATSVKHLRRRNPVSLPDQDLPSGE